MAGRPGLSSIENRLSRRHFPASVILPRFSYHCKLSFSLPLARALSRGWLPVALRPGTPLRGYLTVEMFRDQRCLHNYVVLYGGYSARLRYLTPPHMYQFVFEVEELFLRLKKILLYT